MAIVPSPVRDISPESINKGRVNYKPIPEKRMLGYMSTAALIINKMIGTGIFSMPSSVLTSTGSKGASLFLWVTGGFMTLSGLVENPYTFSSSTVLIIYCYSLIVYLEFGLALPFNGGELVYVGDSSHLSTATIYLIAYNSWTSHIRPRATLRVVCLQFCSYYLEIRLPTQLHSQSICLERFPTTQTRTTGCNSSWHSSASPLFASYICSHGGWGYTSTIP